MYEMGRVNHTPWGMEKSFVRFLDSGRAHTPSLFVITLKFIIKQILKTKVESNFKTEHFVGGREREVYPKKKSKKGFV